MKFLKNYGSICAGAHSLASGTSGVAGKARLELTIISIFFGGGDGVDSSVLWLSFAQQKLGDLCVAVTMLPNKIAIFCRKVVEIAKIGSDHNIGPPTHRLLTYQFLC
jgi:hypothetical protein